MELFKCVNVNIILFPLRAIQDLENSASSDAIVREKIASLPPEVSEASHLEKLQSAKEGKQLMKKVGYFYYFNFF